MNHVTIGQNRARVVHRGGGRTHFLLETGAVVNLPESTVVTTINPEDFRQPVLTPKEHQVNLGKAKTNFDLYVYARAYLPGDVVEGLELYHETEQFSFPSRKISVVSAIKERSK